MNYTKTIEFKNHKLGLYDLETFKNDWGSEPRRGITEKRCKIVKKKGEKLLEITLPKGTESNGGSFWRLDFPSDQTDTTFEYEIMFGDNFNFVRGGKLPGLAGGTAPGGGSKDKDGFSARLMWREMDFEKNMIMKKPLGERMKQLREMIDARETKEKISEQLNLIGNEVIKYEWNCRFLDVIPNKAYLMQYLYYPDKSGRFGENLAYRYDGNKNKKVIIEPNKWYKIKMRIKLSDNPKQEDTILAWVNGRKVLNKKRNLRVDKSFAINQVSFTLFFGGNDETWHTQKDEKVYFRKFKVTGK